MRKCNNHIAHYQKKPIKVKPLIHKESSWRTSSLAKKFLAMTPSLRVIQFAAESDSEQGEDRNSCLSEEVWLTLFLGVTLSSKSCDWLLKETKKNKGAPSNQWREIN
ncbi:hypothetical protein ILYODFUR_020938 [Ilyodon furcidens]|uniref:Uncharacterized protein n=1 Tax=Ilyodon furcidens TaxID=33524 RepID=A0ABV0V4S7_9TELE